MTVYTESFETKFVDILIMSIMSPWRLAVQTSRVILYKR